MSRVTLASITAGSGPGSGVGTWKYAKPTPGWTLDPGWTVPVWAIVWVVPVVTSSRSSVSRQVRPLSWTEAGTAKPSGTSTVGLTHVYTKMYAYSPFAMTLPGW